LKEAVGLRAYGQKDPNMEFKKESYYMFSQLVDDIYDTIVDYLMRITRVDPNKEESQAKKQTVNLNFVHGDTSVIDSQKKGQKSKKSYAEKKGFKRNTRFKVKK
jgi:preprotein translocase subunit SecA